MVTQRLTGAQIIVEYLVKQGVRHAAGIPGHGCWTLVDALLERSDAIRSIQVMHEQSAVHLADGYYRASGDPMLAFTSIGPGAAVGELSLLDRGPRTATVTCDTDCTVLVLGAREFTALLDEVPGLTHKVLSRLAAWVRDLDSQVYG